MLGWGVRYEPQLATLVAEAPEGDGWLHEIKYDGYRIGCIVRRGHAQLISRNGNDWSERFAAVAEAAAALPVKSALLDGEVAAVLPSGVTSFQALQNALGARGKNLVYFAFDLHELDGEDLRRRPLEERKAALREVIERAGKSAEAIIRYSDHVVGEGARFFAEACRAGLEGIVAKRRGEPHRAGRTTGWLKIKCVTRQELVIGGFTEPEGTRAGLGALLLGAHDDDGALSYAGKVGTGFTRQTATALRERLDQIERDTCPFQPRPEARQLGKKVHWVEPTLVAEVVFAEWTDDGRIRHSSFQGLREDRAAHEVRRERPKPLRTDGTAVKRGPRRR
jgi:bifunctional non-homologous end joining protein LigD